MGLRLAPKPQPQPQALRAHYCVPVDLDVLLAPRAAPPFVRAVEREEPPADVPSAGFHRSRTRT